MMEDKKREANYGDLIAIEGIRRQLGQMSDEIPRVAQNYVRAVGDADPHIFNYLHSALSLIDMAKQQLSHAHNWLMPDDGDDEVAE